MAGLRASASLCLRPFHSESGHDIMNISKYEQRVLHALAQGGRIVHRRAETGQIVAVDCFTRDGWLLPDCNMAVFRRLKRRRLIGSTNGQPYRITRAGLGAVRAQLDNR
jgi:uncharacterized protein YjhX (UPF0386 family)